MNGHETQPKAKERAGDGCCRRGEMQHVADHHDGRACQGRDGVKVGPQDRGNAGHEERTRMPNRSSRRVTPALAPLIAKTNVPTRSSTSSSDMVPSFSQSGELAPTPVRAARLINRRSAEPKTRPGPRQPGFRRPSATSDGSPSEAQVLRRKPQRGRAADARNRQGACAPACPASSR